MKKILLTGSAGFLSHHFIPEFKNAGYFVVGVDKRPIIKGHSKPDHFIQCNVQDLNYRDLCNVSYVIHCAWRTNIPDCIRHPKESTYENIDMTMHLMEVCKEAGVKKFIFPSTASLYAHNPTPWTEDMPLETIEPYSWQKVCCEALCKMNKDKLPYAIPRFFQIFGEYQREDTALAAFLKFKKEGQPITLTETMAQSKFKSGQRDFIYAGDVARAVRMIMESDETGVFNVASGTVLTMEDIATALQAEVKWIPKREFECERHEADIKKILALGWKPKTNILTWLKKQV